MKAIERIFEYIDFKGINKSELERKTGTSNGYLAKQLQRKADIGESILINILENCPDISPEWLLTGSGQMLKQNVQNLSNDHQTSTCQKADIQVKDNDKNTSVQENQQIIDKLLRRLENQSKEIGRLEAKNDYLSAQLAEKNTMQENARHAKAG